MSSRRWWLYVLLLACLGLSSCGEDTAVSATAAALTPTSEPTPWPTPELVQEDFMVTYYKMHMADGTALEYGVVLPDGYEAEQSYPVLLAMPPGAQTRSMVMAGIDGYWGQTAQQRGWIVVSPIAPDGRLFFQGSEAYIPEFLERIAAIFQPEGGRFHLAGISNGGISTFRLATLYPEQFFDLLALPGFPQPDDVERLDAIKDMPVALYVGQRDFQWVMGAEDAADMLQKLGADVSLTIVPNEEHVIRTLTGEELFDWLDQQRP